MTHPARRLPDDALAAITRPPTTPDDLEVYIPYLLSQLTNRWSIDQNRDLSRHGVNGRTLRALSILHIYKTLTVNEIASYAGVEQSSASRTVDTMVTAGLVVRQIAQDDLRRREIALTAKGQKLLKQLWPITARNYQRLVANIPMRDLRICITTLAAMSRNIGEGSE
jgi:DNA-binding MarR family transcriptional regulator